MLSSRRRGIVPATALLLSLAATGALSAGCSGGGAAENTQADANDDGKASPEEVLALAKTTLDDTSGVQFSLTTDNLPDGVSGITSATGTATDALAFDGQLTVDLAGNSVEVPVVAVEGDVYARLPLTPGFQKVDPGEYGAPDPGTLLDPDQGISTLLSETTGVAEGDTVRGGSENTEILTSYTGTVPASAVTSLIPSAQGDFDATYGVTSQGELRTAELSGVFYPGSTAMTYVVDVTDYGTTKKISAP